MPWLRTLLAIAVGVAVAGCQTTSEWSDWKDITAEQSVVQITWPANMKPAAIKMQTRSERYKFTREERWKWRSGRAWLTKLSGRRYMAISMHDRSVLQKRVISAWKYLRDIGLQVDDADVVMGVNDVGKYFYAVSDRNPRDMVCFVYFQALPQETEAGYREEINAAGGMMSAFDCVPETRLSVADMKALMVPLVENVRLRKK